VGARAYQVDVDNLSVLGHHGEDVALGEIKGETTHEDVRGVGVAGVPGGLPRKGGKEGER
jgi:hypothetical protein